MRLIRKPHPGGVLKGLWERSRNCVRSLIYRHIARYCICERSCRKPFVVSEGAAPHPCSRLHQHKDTFTLALARCEPPPPQPSYSFEWSQSGGAAGVIIMTTDKAVAATTTLQSCKFQSWRITSFLHINLLHEQDFLDCISLAHSLCFHLIVMRIGNKLLKSCNKKISK